MIIKIKKPEHIGKVKLSPEAQRCAVKNMANKQIKFLRTAGQIVSAVFIYDKNGKVSVLNLQKNGNQPAAI